MINRDNISDWLNRANYTAEERRIICAQIMSEAQYWDSTQYLRMMHDSTKRPWVALTPEEVKEISLANRPYVVDMVVALEARLKQKNGYDK